MQEIFIPSYRLVDLPKPHYVYLIKIFSPDAGRQDLVERRYSAFHALHRENGQTLFMNPSDSTSAIKCLPLYMLRKHFNTPSFPPKRIRCTQERILEQRRKELEKYIQTMFNYVPTKPLVANFLGLTESYPTSNDKHISHRPVFLIDSSHSSVKSSLPDIVAEGVADALYGPS